MAIFCELEKFLLDYGLIKLRIDGSICFCDITLLEDMSLPKLSEEEPPYRD